MEKVFSQPLKKFFKFNNKIMVRDFIPNKKIYKFEALAQFIILM